MTTGGHPPHLDGAGSRTPSASSKIAEKEHRTPKNNTSTDEFQPGRHENDRGHSRTPIPKWLNLLELPDMIRRRAFECNLHEDGALYKVIAVTSAERVATASESSNSSDDGDRRKSSAEGGARRRSHDSGPGVSQMLEPLRQCEEGIDARFLESSSDMLWGVDLHLCDLSSLVGVPRDGRSPWHSDDDHEEGSGDTKSWCCVFLDASVNRLRGIDAIANEAGLRRVAMLDVSYNLMDNLDRVQELSDLQLLHTRHELPLRQHTTRLLLQCRARGENQTAQAEVLIASNNHLESATALGKLKGRCPLRHLDLSNNRFSTFPTPRTPNAFRYISTLKLAGNRLAVLEDSVAEALTSLQQLNIAGNEDNELVEINAAELLPALVFLDCSGNRIGDLPDFVETLKSPPRLNEVIATGNPVASEPQYRLTVVINCPSMQRLDHRLVDRAGLARRFHTVLEAKALSDIREAANEEYYREVEEKRAHLERRKGFLKYQQKQLEDTFQNYRLQRHQEVAQCINYAESLRREDRQGDEGGRGALTPKLARSFQDTLKRRRSSDLATLAELTEDASYRRGSTDSLRELLHAIVKKEQRCYNDDVADVSTTRRSLSSTERLTPQRRSNGMAAARSSRTNSSPHDSLRDQSTERSEDYSYDSVDEIHSSSGGSSTINGEREKQRGDSEKGSRGSQGDNSTKLSRDKQSENDSKATTTDERMDSARGGFVDRTQLGSSSRGLDSSVAGGRSKVGSKVDRVASDAEGGSGGSSVRGSREKVLRETPRTPRKANEARVTVSDPAEDSDSSKAGIIRAASGKSETEGKRGEFSRFFGFGRHHP